jgi:hypothetical protein
VVVAAIIVMMVLGSQGTPLSGETPLEPQRITNWFCSSLEIPFDFAKLAKSFPFEQLGAIKTKREPVAKTGNETESTATAVEQSAKGEHFTVSYRYQYSNTDVSSPVGFSIQIQHYQEDMNVDPDATASVWLSSLGKPEFQFGNPIVGVGEKQQYMGYTAYFSYWRSIGTMNMNWFSTTDLAKFSSICKAHR